MLEKWAYKKIIKYFLLLRSQNKKKDFNYSVSQENIFEEERLDINKGIIISFIIGCMATLPIIIVEVFFPGSEELLSKDNLIKWSFYLVILILFVSIEFYYLYIIGFKMIAKLIYKVYILKENNIIKIKIKDKKFLQSLARSSIEFPEKNESSFKLDPYKYKNKNHLLMTLIYKSKVMVSNFISKLIFKKLLTRTGLRGYEPFIAVPITGIWDSFIFYKVINEVKFKILIKIEIEEILDYSQDINNEELKKIINLVSLRYILFGEYNLNIDYLLKELISLYEMKTKIKIQLKTEEVDKLRNKSVQLKHKNLIIKIFSFKYGFYNRHEKKYLNKIGILKEVKLKRKELKKK